MASEVDDGSSFESMLLAQLQELRARVVAEHRREIQAVLNQGKLGQATKNAGQSYSTAWESEPLELNGRRSSSNGDTDSIIEPAHLESDSKLIIDDAQSEDDPDLKEELEALETLPDLPVVEEIPLPPPSKPPVIVTTTQVQQLSPTAGGQGTNGQLQPADHMPKGTPRPSISAPAGQGENTMFLPPGGNSLAAPQRVNMPVMITGVQPKTASQAARIAAIQRACTPDIDSQGASRAGSRAASPERQVTGESELKVTGRGNDAYELDSEGSGGTDQRSGAEFNERQSIDSSMSKTIQIPEQAKTMVSLAVPSALKDGRRSGSKSEARKVEVNSGFRLRTSNSRSASPSHDKSCPQGFGARRCNRDSQGGNEEARQSVRESIIRIQPDSSRRQMNSGRSSLHSNADNLARSHSFNGPASSFNLPIDQNARSCSFRLDDDIYDEDGNSRQAISRGPSLRSRRDSRFSAFCAERSESAGVPRRGHGSLGGSIHMRGSQMSLPDRDRPAMSDENSSRRGSPEEMNVTRFPSMFSDASACSEAQPHYEVLSIWYIRKNRRSETGKKRFDPMKVFEEHEDDEDHTGISRCMVVPGTTKHIIWDAVGLLLIGWDCFSIPLQWFSPAETPFMTACAWITRLYWSLNMIISFMVGFIDSQGAVQMDPAKVAKRYIMTWFILDLLTVGSDWAEVASTAKSSYLTMGTTLRSFRMLRTIRLLRLFRAPMIWRYFSEQIRSEELILVAQLCKMMTLMIVVAHFIACGWYGMGDAGYAGSWLEADGGAIRETDLALRYTMSVHWSLSILTGETVITGTNLAELTYTCTVLFFSFMFSAFLVSSITTAMTRLEIMSRQQSQQLMQLRRYLVDNSISRKLSVRVQRNAQHVMIEQKRNLQEDRVELLKMISDPLLVELHYEVHSHVVMEHPFFCCFNEVNPAGIRKVCHLAVSLLQLSAGDILFSDCETPTNLRMFFPMAGKTIYKQAGTIRPESEEEADNNDGHEIMTLHHDQWMCEGVLWTSWSHCGTLQAKTESRLLVIDASQFHEICIATPMAQVSRYAEAFVEVLNTTDKGAHSDVGEFDQYMEDMIAYAFPELIYETELAREEVAPNNGKFLTRPPHETLARSSAGSHRSIRSAASWRSGQAPFKAPNVMKMISISSKHFTRRGSRGDRDTHGHDMKKHKLRAATNHNLNALMRQKQAQSIWWDELWESVDRVKSYPRNLISNCCDCPWFGGRQASSVKNSIMVCPAASSETVDVPDMIASPSAISCSADVGRHSLVPVDAGSLSTPSSPSSRGSISTPSSAQKQPLRSSLRVSSKPATDTTVEVVECS